MTDSDTAEWKPMAVRAALCLGCTIMGWLFRDHHGLASLLWYAGAYVAGGWDLTQKVWEGLKEKEFGTDFLMLVVAVAAAGIGEYPEGAILMFLFASSGATLASAAVQDPIAAWSFILVADSQRR